MKITENLIALRRARKLSQAAVAAAVGIGPRTYQNYEYGTRIPPLTTAVVLADFYGVSLDELVGRERP